MDKLLFFNMVIISISLSIDALGIGIAYQMNKVKITLLAKIIIGCMSSIVMYLSLSIGNYIAAQMPSDVAKIIGVSLLTLIGLMFIRNGVYGNKDSTYDFNKSCNIEPVEAVVLGITLSIDTISAGIAISAIGLYNDIIPIMVGIMQILLLTLGEQVVGKSTLLQKGNSTLCGIFSGGILLLMAILRGIYG